jgi:PAS domain S-box-containing protein
MQDADANHRGSGMPDTAAATEDGRSHDLNEKVVVGVREYAIFALDPTGDILSWGRGAERLTGYAAAEVISRPYAALSHRDDEAEVARALACARAEGSWSMERWWRRRDGRLVWVEELINPLDDDGFVVITRDLTEHVEQEERRVASAVREEAGLGRESILRSELQAAERRASFLAEASSILVATSLDFDSTVKALARLAVSRLADWCVIHSITEPGTLDLADAAHRDPALEDDLETVTARGVRERWSSAVHSVIQTGQAQIIDRFELASWIDGADDQLLAGAAEASAMITPLLGRGVVLGAVTFIATNDRQYDEEDLALAEELGRRAATALDNARLYRDAQEANRAKADFLAVMSHELRTPLNAIMGYSDLMDAGISGTLAPRQRRQVDRIRASARHLLQLIEEILSYARIEAGGEELNPGVVDAHELIREAAAVIEPMAHARELDFIVDRDGQPITLETDAGKLRQVLVNLLSNAVKFTERGSVELRVTLDDDHVTFHIVDTGIGIPEDHLDRIFDPFWQAERPNTRTVGGTGLGLSVSRRYVRLLRGELRIDSEVGSGTHIRVCLPLRITGRQAE